MALRFTPEPTGSLWICAAFVALSTIPSSGQTVAEDVDLQADATTSVSRLPKHVTPQTKAAIDRGRRRQTPVPQPDRHRHCHRRSGLGSIGLGRRGRRERIVVCH